MNYACDPSTWVEKYADYLYNYALARVSDEELAKDLVQETFLAGLERIVKFEGRSSESTWLTAILRNKIIDIYRKKSSSMLIKSNQHTDQFDEDRFFNAENGHWREKHKPLEFGIEKEDPLEKKELRIILQRCIKKLPGLWHLVFTMKYMEDEKTEVICKELKISASNFWVIIHRAKVNLRACLQENWI